MKGWKETAERYIVFLDVMGFSDLIYRNDHSVVKEKMKKLSLLVSEIELNNKSKTSGNTVGTVIFSDSILLIGKDSAQRTLEDILFICQRFLTDALENGIPLKGAMSKGTLTVDFNNSLFFGQPLVDAYKLQDELFMYGIILDHKVEKDTLMNDKIWQGYCTFTKTPTKSGLINHTSINWIFWANIMDKVKSGLTINEITELKGIESNPSIDIINEFYAEMTGYPRKYLDNTIDFINTVCKKNS